jgi:hypothetical protein
MGHNPPSNRSTWARLSDWAADGRCIRVRCNLCRRTLHFLASDLVTVYHPSTLAHTWRPACSHCGRVDYVSVRSFFPGPDDVGKIMMRRPAGHRRIQLWKNELYEPLPKAASDSPKSE